jgi:Protein of unknown function (DUF1059)
MTTERKVIDCRWFPTEKPCDIAISGNEEEVLNIAVQHAVQSHGQQDTPELREQLRSMLCDEREISPSSLLSTSETSGEDVRGEEMLDRPPSKRRHAA